MYTAPDTWHMLQAIQYRVQSEVLVNASTGVYDPAGVSPFDAWSITPDPSDQQSDYARYGTSNPVGTCANAIYIGHPREVKSKYGAWAEIVPGDENVYRRAFGGKIWDESFVYFRVVVKYLPDWFATWKQIVNIRDACHVVIAKHAELPDAPTVQAVKEEVSKHDPTGFFFDEFLGRSYICWATIWWHRQMWNASTGIIP